MSHVDKAIVSLSGLRVADIADMLERTRQTVSRGINNPDKNYLGRDDLEIIRKQLVERHSSRAAKFARFIREQFEEKASGAGQSRRAVDDAIASATTASIYVYDIEQLEIDLPRSFDVVTRVLQNEKIAVKLFSSNDRGQALAEDFSRNVLGREAFASRLRDGSIEFHCKDVVKALPAMIVFDEETKPQVYVATWADFELLSEFQGRRLANNLPNLRF